MLLDGFLLDFREDIALGYGLVGFLRQSVSVPQLFKLMSVIGRNGLKSELT
jgi:hypothetical protein